MRWKTSKGEVVPLFIEKSNGYSYLVYGYMNVETKEYYDKETIQREIKAGNRMGQLSRWMPMSRLWLGICRRY